VTRAADTLRTVAAVALIVPWACATRSKPAQSEPRTTQPSTFASLVSNPGAPAGTVAAIEISPAQAGLWRYEWIAGRNRGAALFRREATSEHGAQWVDIEDGARATFWRVDAGGDIVMSAVIDHEEKALTLFDPPLLLWPRELGAGEERRAEAAMRVVNRDQPSQERERGRALRTVRSTGIATVQSPLGEILCTRLDVQFLADLRLARAETRTIVFVAEPLGVVLEQSLERVRVLGAFERKTDRVRLITAGPEPLGSP
jgi:hypothetical protein